jgi:hypothetical protein
MRTEFHYKESIYQIEFNPINLSQSLAVDYNSYNDNHISSFMEMKSILDNIDFTISKDNKVVVDSDSDLSKLKFDFVQELCSAIRPHLYLSDQEINNFIQKSKIFLQEKKTNLPLPEEFFIAMQIVEKNIQLTLNELMSMETKKYEKIQLGISLLNKEVFQYKQK